MNMIPKILMFGYASTQIFSLVDLEYNHDFEFDDKKKPMVLVFSDNEPLFVGNIVAYDEESKQYEVNQKNNLDDSMLFNPSDLYELDDIRKSVTNNLTYTTNTSFKVAEYAEKCDGSWTILPNWKENTGRYGENNEKTIDLCDNALYIEVEKFMRRNTEVTTGENSQKKKRIMEVQKLEKKPYKIAFMEKKTQKFDLYAKEDVTKISDKDVKKFKANSDVIVLDTKDKYFSKIVQFIEYEDSENKNCKVNFTTNDSKTLKYTLSCDNLMPLEDVEKHVLLTIPKHFPLTIHDIQKGENIEIEEVSYENYKENNLDQYVGQIKRENDTDIEFMLKEKSNYVDKKLKKSFKKFLEGKKLQPGEDILVRSNKGNYYFGKVQTECDQVPQCEIKDNDNEDLPTKNNLLPLGEVIEYHKGLTKEEKDEIDIRVYKKIAEIEDEDEQQENSPMQNLMQSAMGMMGNMMGNTKKEERQGDNTSMQNPFQSMMENMMGAFGQGMPGMEQPDDKNYNSEGCKNI